MAVKIKAEKRHKNYVDMNGLDTLVMSRFAYMPAVRHQLDFRPVSETLELVRLAVDPWNDRLYLRMVTPYPLKYRPRVDLIKTSDRNKTVQISGWGEIEIIKKASRDPRTLLVELRGGKLLPFGQEKFP